MEVIIDQVGSDILKRVKYTAIIPSSSESITHAQRERMVIIQLDYLIDWSAVREYRLFTLLFFSFFFLLVFLSHSRISLLSLFYFLFLLSDRKDGRRRPGRAPKKWIIQISQRVVGRRTMSDRFYWTWIYSILSSNEFHSLFLSKGNVIDLIIKEKSISYHFRWAWVSSIWL